MQASKPRLLPFDVSACQIRDDSFETTGRLEIRSCSPLLPNQGEFLNVEGHGRLYELAVEDVRTLPGGCAATCGHPPDRHAFAEGPAGLTSWKIGRTP